MRLIFIPLLIAAGDPSQELAATLSIVSFAAAFVIHALGAELWIRRTRRARPAAGAGRDRLALGVPAGR